VSNLLDLIEQGKLTRAGAALTDSVDDLRAALQRWDEQQDDQDRVVAWKAILNGEEDDPTFVWKDSWGPQPEEADVSYDEVDEVQADLNETYAEILDTIVSILRAEA
jgi:hypothetical protein